MKNLKIEKRIVVAMGLMFCGAMNVGAQSVTYRHDAAKMNQITVGEIGSGSLNPQLLLPNTAQVVQQECGKQEQTVVPYPCRGEPV